MAIAAEEAAAAEEAVAASEGRIEEIAKISAALEDDADDRDIPSDSGKATSEESNADGDGFEPGVGEAAAAAEVDQDEAAAAEEANAFPDTNIVLKFDRGDSLAMRADSAESVDEPITPTAGVPAERSSSGLGVRGLSAKEKRQRKKERAKQLKEQGREHDGGDGMPSGSSATADDLRTAADEPWIDETKGGKKGKGKGKGKQKQKQEVDMATVKAKRGQATKKKKAKTKYADQDEDERQLAMELLASSGGTKPQSKKAKRAARKERGQVGSKQIQATGAQGMVAPEEAAAKIEATLAPRNGHEGDWDDERVMAAKDAKHIRMREVAAEEEEEEIRKILEDEKIQLLDEAERAGVSYLDALTGCPRADDIIQFAIPVCAPLSALNNYKYRIKLLPGTGRKGQAAKTAVHMFSTLREASDREKEVMKCVKDTEYTTNLPGKVKVMGGALGKRK